MLVCPRQGEAGSVVLWGTDMATLSDLFQASIGSKCDSLCSVSQSITGAADGLNCPFILHSSSLICE